MNTEIEFLGLRANVSSRTRRRWFVGLLYAGFSLLLIGWFSFYGSLTVTIPVILGVLYLSKLLGGRNLEGGLIPPADRGDERDMRRRDHAYFVAYWWWDLALLPAFLSTGLKNIPISGRWAPALHLLFARLPWGLLIAALLLYYTLPQAILLWTEPDLEEELRG
ncbi:MAG: hypothetical protein RB191_20820 [Terriglobia bacterium]|nr:hypothetical protein [Terriglobia bacterium]